jgi:hypothetical protein
MMQFELLHLSHEKDVRQELICLFIPQTICLYFSPILYVLQGSKLAPFDPPTFSYLIVVPSYLLRGC